MHFRLHGKEDFSSLHNTSLVTSQERTTTASGFDKRLDEDAVMLALKRVKGCRCYFKQFIGSSIS